MVDIKFRALTKMWDEIIWLLSKVENNLNGHENGYYISNKAGSPFAYLVDEDTISQYIGLSDLNDIEIYNGDIIRYNNGKEFRVEYNEDSASFNLRWLNNNIGSTNITCDTIIDEWIEVINNIHKQIFKNKKNYN